MGDDEAVDVLVPFAAVHVDHGVGTQDALGRDQVRDPLGERALGVAGPDTVHVLAVARAHVGRVTDDRGGVGSEHDVDPAGQGGGIELVPEPGNSVLRGVLGAMHAADDRQRRTIPVALGDTDGDGDLLAVGVVTDGEPDHLLACHRYTLLDRRAPRVRWEVSRSGPARS
jgi:hypothetical protein